MGDVGYGVATNHAEAPLVEDGELHEPVFTSSSESACFRPRLAAGGGLYNDLVERQRLFQQAVFDGEIHRDLQVAAA